MFGTYTRAAADRAFRVAQAGAVRWATTTREEALLMQASMRREKRRPPKLGVHLASDFAVFKAEWQRCVEGGKVVPSVVQLVKEYEHDSKNAMKFDTKHEFDAKELRAFMKEQQDAGVYRPVVADLIALIPHYSSYEVSFEMFEEVLRYVRGDATKLSVTQEILVEEAGAAMLRGIKSPAGDVNDRIAAVMATLRKEGVTPTAKHWVLALTTLRSAGGTHEEMDALWRAMAEGEQRANSYHYHQYIMACNDRMKELCVGPTPKDELGKMVTAEVNRAERKFQEGVRLRAGDMSIPASVVMRMLRNAARRCNTGQERTERFMEFVNTCPQAVPNVIALEHIRRLY